MMKNKKWKEFDKLTYRCYNNMAGLDSDDTCWKQAFDLLMKIVREERKQNPDFAKELYLLDDETDYVHDIVEWIEDCLDETDMKEEYQQLLEMCNELIENFVWSGYTGSDMKFRKSGALRALKRIDEAVQLCNKWIDTEPENIMAGTAYVYALIDAKEYEKAKKIIEMFLDEGTECSEDNEIMFIAASRYYGAAGDKKKQKELDKMIKAYDDYVDNKMLSDWLEGEDEDDWEYDFL